MHRNTYFLVIVLAIFAALLIGVNVGKKMSKQSTPTLPITTPTPATKTKTFINTYCGFSLIYPSAFTVLENASGSAILQNPDTSNQSITLTCQKEIPRPALTLDNIETISIPDSSISATLYHDSSQKDGTPIDILIFSHPKTKMDVFIAGYGTAFNEAIQTLRILP